MHPKIPTGRYCYGYVPTRASGFRTLAEVSAHLATVPEKEWWAEYRRLTELVNCKYYRYIGHGRVRCKATGVVAGLWGSKAEHLAGIFYRKHPKARQDGFILGDQCKECHLNREGPDFAFPEPSFLLAAARSRHKATGGGS